MKTVIHFLVAMALSHAVHAQTNVLLEKSDCFLADCSFLESYPNVEFGKMIVPENYAQPQNRKIKIAYAIIKAFEEPKSKDAIIVFQGGWGSPLLKYLRGYAQNFPIKNRDVILFDYRGSGYSEPQLCDWLGDAAWEDLAENLTNEQFDKNQTQKLNQCLDSLTLRTIDFNQYGSNTKTKDAVMLAEQLGYDSYNLMGISYGTRSILSFIRNAANSSIKIRSAILDSNHPMGNNRAYIGTNTENYVRVLELFLADCEKDPKCNGAFPNLKNRFENFLNELESEPWTIVLDDGTHFTPNRHEINALLFQFLYIRSYYKDIPLIMEQMMHRNGVAFASVIQNIKPQVKDNFNGLGLVNFVYDHKQQKDSIMAFLEATKGSYSPFENMNPYLNFFLNDHRIASDSLDKKSITSSIPSLFLAGEYDPTTPPKWTKEVAKGFENHYYFEVKRYGHGVAPSPCGEALLTEFFNDPNTKPSSACIESLGENNINFVTSYYQNPKISKLASGIFQMRNIPLLVGVVLLLIFSLINSISGLRSWLVKKDTNGVFLTLASIGILVFLIALVLAINQTASSNPFLMAFGLSDSSSWLFYLIPFVLGLVFLAIVRWFKNKKTAWNSLTAVSLVVFVVIVMAYNLYPNF